MLEFIYLVYIYFKYIYLKVFDIYEYISMVDTYVYKYMLFIILILVRP